MNETIKFYSLSFKIYCCAVLQLYGLFSSSHIKLDINSLHGTNYKSAKETIKAIKTPRLNVCFEAEPVNCDTGPLYVLLLVA